LKIFKNWGHIYDLESRIIGGNYGHYGLLRVFTDFDKISKKEGLDERNKV